MQKNKTQLPTYAAYYGRANCFKVNQINLPNVLQFRAQVGPRAHEWHLRKWQSSA